MRKLKVEEFERAMRRSWPRMMDTTDIAEFTGWTKLSILTWIRDGELSGAVTTDRGATATVLIPRELVFAQLDPREIDAAAVSGAETT
ncbi:hypothetical protein ACTXPC_15515 [Brachybacterium alimentarium]|uniref:hypothetical protein n=1 Tax=Brachybacterium alimentarium TaxID=47845 RepID=UPI0011C03ACC|nr:hypothetical protein [Brachybacterium alimentarium]